MRTTKTSVIALLGITTLFPIVASGQVLFDFEDQSMSRSVRDFSITEGGITASFLDPGADSWIQDWTLSGVPSSWGVRHFVPAFLGTNHQIVDFSAILTALSIEFGDFGSEDDEVHIRAWSGFGGTGTIVDSDNVFYPITLTLPVDVATASVTSAVGFRSIEFWEDGFSGHNDVAFDNIRVLAIPEMSTLTGAGILFLAMILGGFGNRHCSPNH